MLSENAERRLRSVSVNAKVVENENERKQRLKVESEERLARAGFVLRNKENRPMRSLSTNSMPARFPSPGSPGVWNQGTSLLGRILSHGIRLALCQDAQQPRRALHPNDFTQQIQHRPHLELSPGRTIQFDLSDWAPVAFRSMRELDEIEENDFFNSLTCAPLGGGNLGSGKSGAVFFKSGDEIFIVKELRRSEKDTLIQVLQSMMQHFKDFPHSFLPKFLGLYTFEAIPGLLQQSLTIVVMRNVLQFPREVDLFSEVYDLKGSVQNRFTSSSFRSLHSLASDGGASISSIDLDENEQQRSSSFKTPIRRKQQLRRGVDKTPQVLKDLNLHSKFVVGAERKGLIMSQLQQDVSWLENHNLMDYSLLLGVVCSEKMEPGFSSPACFSTCSSAASTPKSESAKTEDSSSELGAILWRNQLQRKETAALLPDGAIIDLKIIGHGKARRSRESSSMFRQSCTLYTFLVTRNSEEEGEELNSSELQSWIVYRRYKDFEKLQKGLQEELRSANIALDLPALPCKQRIGFMDPEFIKRRERELHAWIHSILRLVGYRIMSPALHEFLTSKANKAPPKYELEFTSNPHLLLQRRFSASESVSSFEPLPERTRSISESSADSQEIDPSSELHEDLWKSLGGRLHQEIEALRKPINNPSAKPQRVTLYIGIIDILQEFNFGKKIESAFKGLLQNADGISAVDPDRYSERFVSFINDYVFE